MTGEVPKLPWRIVPAEMDGDDVINGAGLKDATGRSVYTVDCGDYNTLNELTATFIVQAVNSHKALVKALTEIDARMCDQELCGHFTAEEMRGVISAALAKVNREL